MKTLLKTIYSSNNKWSSKDNAERSNGRQHCRSKEYFFYSNKYAKLSIFILFSLRLTKPEGRGSIRWLVDLGAQRRR